MSVVCCGCFRAFGCCDELSTRVSASIGKRRLVVCVTGQILHHYEVAETTVGSADVQSRLRARIHDPTTTCHLI